jgi:DsbC/DsbD-like thiol-disulfide interchange protein
MKPYLLPATLLLLCALAHADDAPVKATLLASVESAKPGSEFTLGLRLKIAPHWHTYWINPGESGEPTRIKFEVPAGFEVGDIQWPIPTRIEIAGGITYGYEDEVLLLIPVKVGKAIAPRGNAVLHADATWLCCKETCIEGGAKLHINIPLAEESKPAHADLFDAWRAKLPLTPQQAKPYLEAVDQTPAGVLLVRWKQAPKKVEWFPIATREVAVENVVVKHDGLASEIRYKTTIFKQPAPDMLQNVLVFEDAAGVRRGVAVPSGVSK